MCPLAAGAQKKPGLDRVKDNIVVLEGPKAHTCTDANLNKLQVQAKPSHSRGRRLDPAQSKRRERSQVAKQASQKTSTWSFLMQAKPSRSKGRRLALAKHEGRERSHVAKQASQNTSTWSCYI